MKSTEMFGNAKWLGMENCVNPYVRGFFEAKDVKKAELVICGLGFFECYCNGRRISDDLFVPLYTDFQPRDLYVKGEPFGEVAEHRIYCPRYDVTPFIKEGRNLLCVELFPGWYASSIHDGVAYQAPYGEITLCWRLKTTNWDGSVTEAVSDGSMKWARGLISRCNLFLGEEQDYQYARDGWLEADYDDSDWNPVQIIEGPQSRFYEQDCPADRIIRRTRPRPVRRFDKTTVYDMGENCTGYPELYCESKEPQTVEVTFAEELNDDGTLDREHVYGQKSSFRLDGRPRRFHTRSTWHGFRYFELTNNAVPVDCAVVHTDIPVTSSFACDHPTLNWLYDAYLRTQLSNMHCGVPSDCPHIERRGYTGDGQLTCETAMTLFDAERFYRKWIGDISDCQDRLSGHVQYTAPYTTCGGGPGGWGCAIVLVPYVFYRQYGDEKPMRELFPQMLRYFDYLEAHSENGLVTSDRPGAWCLGDWASSEEMKVPEPYVNTYFYIKSMQTALKIAAVTGLRERDALLTRRVEERKRAIIERYFDPASGNFADNVQGANCFAVDVGLGDERAFLNLARHYEETGNYDGGIFGTDLTTRLLFRRGRGELAYRLLTSEKPRSFYDMKRRGASTIWEYFTGTRSHNHPMFGAVTRFLFQDVLGIRQTEDSAGYEKVLIAPCLIKDLSWAKGSVTTKRGPIAAEYCKERGQIFFRVGISEDIQADFVFGGVKKRLSAGENRFDFRL